MVEATIEPDGSGRLTLTYYLARHATLAGETRRLSSPHVRVLSVRGIGDLRGVADVRFDDVTKLSTAELFREVAVTRRRAGAEEELRLVLRNPLTPPQRETLARRAREAPESPGPRIVLALPGRVTGATHDAQIDGARVTWTVSLREYAAADVLDLAARWAPP